jgi:hypothetical protein
MKKSELLMKKIQKAQYLLEQVDAIQQELFSEFETEAMGEEEFNVEDTMTVLSDFVDTISTDLEKTRIKSILQTLYVEAQNVTV